MADWRLDRGRKKRRIQTVGAINPTEPAPGGMVQRVESNIMTPRPENATTVAKARRPLLDYYIDKYTEGSNVPSYKPQATTVSTPGRTGLARYAAGAGEAKPSKVGDLESMLQEAVYQATSKRGMGRGRRSALAQVVSALSGALTGREATQARREAGRGVGAEALYRGDIDVAGLGIEERRGEAALGLEGRAQEISREKIGLQAAIAKRGFGLEAGRLGLAERALGVEAGLKREQMVTRSRDYNRYIEMFGGPKGAKGSAKNLELFQRERGSLLRQKQKSIDMLLEGKGGKVVKIKKIKDQIANIDARYDAQLESLTQSFNATYPEMGGRGAFGEQPTPPGDELSNLRAIADEAGMDMNELLEQIMAIE